MNQPNDDRVDSYWAKPCRGCAETGKSNRECVTDLAGEIGLTLEQAMAQFGPTRYTDPVTTRWSSGWEAKAEADG